MLGTEVIEINSRFFHHYNLLLVRGIKLAPTGTGYNKIIVSCTLYTKKGIFYFCHRSNHLIYKYVR